MPKVFLDQKAKTSIESFYSAISDFENYHRFLPEVLASKIETVSPLFVQFEIELIKKFQYTLEFKCEAPHLVTWKLVSSNFFKKNEGAWSLKSLSANEVDVHYELNVEMGFFAPAMVIKKITEINLPIMFKNFEEEAKRRQKCQN